MENRGLWGTRAGFIMAAIGSAIGLGNIWRFPYMVAKNGGGAFLIAYFIALFTAGIPLMIMEFGLGHKYRLAAPGVFAKINRKFEWIGWWQCAIAFAISVYYVVIIGWAMSYTVFSFDLKWGADTSGFFFNDFLGLTSGPMELGGLKTQIVIPLLLVWGINYAVLTAGIKEGIEKASKIFMPILIVGMVIICIRGLTLPGSMQGLEYMFKPDFSKIMDGKIWVAAYSQVFNTLSICFAIMLAYSSYLPKKSDIVNNAFIAALGNCSFSLLAGIGVFGILGYMANVQGVAVEEVARAGVGLAFVTYPTAINQLAGGNTLFALLFFGCLVFAGISSSMSIIESFVSGIVDKFGWKRQKTLNVSCGFGAIVSLIFATGAGLYILDIADYFIINYGIAIAGFVETIIVAWYLGLKPIKDHINPISDFPVGKWWDICIKYVTPVLLGTMIVVNIYSFIKEPYEGYPMNALFMMGIGVVLGTVVVGIVMGKLKGSDEFESNLLGKSYELDFEKGVEI